MGSGNRAHGVAPARIAVFLHSLSGGGAQRRTVTLVNGFAARGHGVTLVVVRSGGPLRDLVDTGVRVVALAPAGAFGRVTRRLPRRVQLMLAIPSLARWLRRERLDVVLSAASHVHLPLLWAHRLAGTCAPVVLRVSNHVSRSKRGRSKRLFAPRLARRWYARAAAVIAVSHGVADDVARMAGVARERITAIYSPIVTPDFAERARGPLDHPWFRAAEPPIVLGIGRLVRQKDFPTLVRAFARVRAVRPARLVILGRAKQNRRRRALEALIAELGVSRDVEIAGYVPNVLPYLREAGVFVLSSAWEGLPGALIEALACGCPIVSTDCPSGPDEILEGGRLGALVAVGDDDAMAAAMLHALDTPRARRPPCTRAFDADDSIDRYLAVLLAAARSNAAASPDIRNGSRPVRGAPGECATDRPVSPSPPEARSTESEPGTRSRSPSPTHAG